MKALREHVAAWLDVMSADTARVADEVTQGNLRRLRWLVWVIIPFMLLHVLVFWFGRTGGSPVVQLWKNHIGWAHLGSALWLLLLALASSQASRQAAIGPWARTLQLVAPLSCLLFTAIFAVIDQRVTSNISPYLIGTMFTSLLFLIPPSNAVVIYTVAYLFFAVGMGFTQDDPVQLLTNRANGMGASIMGAVLAMVLWQKNARYLSLQRELHSRNLALVKQQEELVWLATRDSLTGLYNRGELLRIAEAELRRAQRLHTDTSAIMVDLDHFKKINDTYGHLAGDIVLRHTATLLTQGVRATDFVGRMGGEEFMVLLPHTTLESAQKVAEKLLQLLRESSAAISGDLRIPVTASFGVGMLPAGQTGSVNWLYAAADHGLYEAKRQGRNRVHRAEPDGTLTPSDFQRMRRQ